MFYVSHIGSLSNFFFVLSTSHRLFFISFFPICTDSLHWNNIASFPMQVRWTTGVAPSSLLLICQITYNKIIPYMKFWQYETLKNSKKYCKKNFTHKVSVNLISLLVSLIKKEVLYIILKEVDF